MGGMFAREDYEFWLTTIRMGHDRFVAEQELESDEDDRKLVAVNILIAYNHLIGDGSPFKDKLTEDDLRTVAIARGLNDDVPAGKPS